MKYDKAALENYFAQIMNPNTMGKFSSNKEDSTYKLIAVVDDFLKSESLVSSSSQQSMALESFSGEVRSLAIENFASMSSQSVFDLVKAAGVPERFQMAACKDVVNLLHRVSKGDTAFTTHVAEGRRSAQEGLIYPDLSAMFGAQTAFNLLSQQPGTESFGVDVNTNLFDARVAIIVRLMRFHASIIDRLVGRRPTTSDHVIIDVPVTEVYQLDKSQNVSRDVRYGSHRQPMILMYRDPTAVDTTAQRIHLRMENATKGELVEADILKADAVANLIDLSVDPSKVQFSKVDYSDLVSEGGQLEKIYVKVVQTPASGSPVEELIALTATDSSSTFVTMANNRSAAERVCNFRKTFVLTSDAKQRDGSGSAILGLLNTTHAFRLDARMTVVVDIQKQGDITASGITLNPTFINLNKGTVDPAQKDIADTVSFEVYGYSVDFKFNEENLRKAKLAVKMTKRQLGFNIPVCRTVLVEYSHQQTVAEEIMATVNNVNILGADARGVGLIIDAINHGHEMLEAEKTYVEEDYNDRVMYKYAAGLQVLPTVVKDTLDIEAILANLSGGTLIADVRGMVDYYLIEKFANIQWNSMFRQALGEQKLRWKCMTTVVVSKMLFNIPQKNNPATINPEGGADYAFELPDSTHVDVVETTFQKYENLMVFIPRIDDEESILNFGHNYDRGTWVANYGYTADSAATRRIATNPREQVWPTNMVAMILNVVGIDKLIEKAGTLKVTGSVVTTP